MYFRISNSVIVLRCKYSYSDMHRQHVYEKMTQLHNSMSQEIPFFNNQLVDGIPNLLNFLRSRSRDNKSLNGIVLTLIELVAK